MFFPWSYEEEQEALAALEARLGNDSVEGSSTPKPSQGKIYFSRELLVESMEGRRVELLTITAPPAAEAPLDREAWPEHHQLFPRREKARRPVRFSEKPVVVFSARVHPGETPASHALWGVLQLLTRPDDPRAETLRRQFVFKVIPMLNPDGVARGHYRADTMGLNLNRFYDSPSPVEHPTVWAMRQLVDSIAKTGRLHCFVDFHAHASKRGCFFYGNHLPALDDQVENELFVTLASLHSGHIDVNGSCFSEKNMKAKDKRDDGVSKEGSSRVALYKSTGLVRCYTLECNYNTGKEVQACPPPARTLAAARDDPCPPQDKSSKASARPPRYDPPLWASVGMACAFALLELHQIHPASRIPGSPFRSLDRLRSFLRKKLGLQAAYRSQARRATAAAGEARNASRAADGGAKSKGGTACGGRETHGSKSPAGVALSPRSTTSKSSISSSRVASRQGSTTGSVGPPVGGPRWKSGGKVSSKIRIERGVAPATLIPLPPMKPARAAEMPSANGNQCSKAGSENTRIRLPSVRLAAPSGAGDRGIARRTTTATASRKNTRGRPWKVEGEGGE